MSTTFRSLNSIILFSRNDLTCQIVFDVGLYLVLSISSFMSYVCSLTARCVLVRFPDWQTRDGFMLFHIWTRVSAAVSLKNDVNMHFCFNIKSTFVLKQIVHSEIRNWCLVFLWSSTCQKKSQACYSRQSIDLGCGLSWHIHMILASPLDNGRE